MKQRDVIVIIMVILVGTNILAWLAVFELAKPQYLEVTFFDVGQGDSIFIETPQRHQILIDGGPTPAILEKLGREMPFWDKTLDLIILTHPEKDHITGLLDVLKRYKVENILWTGIERDTAEYFEWQSLIEKEGAGIFIAQSGRKIACLKCHFKQWKMDILFPLDSLSGQNIQKSNNTSVVVRLEIGDNNFLFTGDIEKEVERLLAEKSDDINSDVLKVAHHGSKTSTTREFLDKVSPVIAVISSGRDNRYGHPHPNTLEILEQYGAEILRTDILGDVKIISDGLVLKTKTRK